MSIDQSGTSLPRQGGELADLSLRPADVSPGATIGVALSGGGVRAALFSLGVVLGLIETGCHRRVGCVTSVSGGSIVNAALAHAPGWTTGTLDDFDRLARSLASSLAGRGVFMFNRRRLAAAARYAVGLAFNVLVFLTVGVSFLLSTLRQEYGLDTSGYFTQLPWRSIGWIALASLPAAALVAAVLFRRSAQEAEYRSTINAVTDAATGRAAEGLVSEWGRSSEDGDPSPMHVLVATDLLSGEPMYFSTQFVHSPTYGWSAPNDLQTAEALYSSAAFPGVFPPKRVALSRLNFQNGDMASDRPSWVRLADGGIYNNLGDDWFKVLKTTPGRLWQFGELRVKAPAAIADENIIRVNAGAPSQRLQSLPPWPFTLARIMSVLYDNTVKPRIESLQLDGRPVIDIKQSPLEFAADLAKVENEAGLRAKELLADLSSLPEEFWTNLKTGTAGTKTKLTPTGEREGTLLMLHGYLSSVVLMYARFGGERPRPLRGESYFIRLVRGSKPSSPAVAPTAVESSPAVETV